MVAYLLVDRRWLYGGLLLGAGIGVARIITLHPHVRDSTRLLLLGDSLAVGLSPHVRDLATEIGVPYLGAGVVGSRIDQWLTSRWLTDSLREFEPTLALVILGTNDAFSSLSVEALGENQRALLAKLGAVEVVWIGAPTLPERYGGRAPHVELLDTIREGAPYYYPSHELDIPRGPDGLHPTARGYAGWAGAIWDWLT